MTASGVEGSSRFDSDVYLDEEDEEGISSTGFAARDRYIKEKRKQDSESADDLSSIHAVDSEEEVS